LQRHRTRCSRFYAAPRETGTDDSYKPLFDPDFKLPPKLPPEEGIFIELSNTPRYFSENDVIRAISSVVNPTGNQDPPPEVAKISLADVVTIVQRLEPTANSETDYGNYLFPERRWVIGFKNEIHAKTFTRELNNKPFGLVKLKARFLGRILFDSRTTFIPLMISVKNLPKDMSASELKNWITQVKNINLNVEKKVGSDTALIKVADESERSFILLTRNLTKISENTVQMEPVDGH